MADTMRKNADVGTRGGAVLSSEKPLQMKVALPRLEGESLSGYGRACDADSMPHPQPSGPS